MFDHIQIRDEPPTLVCVVDKPFFTNGFFFLINIRL